MCIHLETLLLCYILPLLRVWHGPWAPFPRLFVLPHSPSALPTCKYEHAPPQYAVCPSTAHTLRSLCGGMYVNGHTSAWNNGLLPERKIQCTIHGTQGQFATLFGFLQYPPAFY